MTAIDISDGIMLKVSHLKPLVVWKPPNILRHLWPTTCVIRFQHMISHAQWIMQ